MTALSSNVFLANQLSRQDLVDSMFNGKAITIRNVHGISGNNVTGIVNSFEHEDGSGSSFNIRLGDKTIHTRTTDTPKAFGLNYEQIENSLTYNNKPPTRDMLIESFLEQKPLIGQFNLKGESLILTGVVTKIEREDGSGQSFKIVLNHRTRLYVRASRD